MGLSPQRPVYRSYKQDKKAVQKYLNTSYSAIEKRAKKLGAEIFFMDESTVRSDCHHGTTWSPVGETSVVEDSGDRFAHKLISAVSALGEMRFRFIEGRMNSDGFIEFSRKLSEDIGKPIIVIVDNASYHKSKKVMALGTEGGDRIHIELLPPYSPELNQDEQVWNYAKKRLGKLYVISKEEMKTALLSIMRSILLIKEVLG